MKSNQHVLKILFLGKDKPAVRQAIKYLLDQPEYEIVNLVTPSESLVEFAKSLGVETLSHEQAHQQSWKDTDLAVSYLYPKKIGEPILNGPILGCVNLHPAPLPKYRGVAPYSRAILEGESIYGVSAHFVDKDFDSGNIIGVKTFSINPDTITAWDLEREAAKQLFALFTTTMERFLHGRPDSFGQQDAKFIYTSQKDLDVLREIKSDDDSILISRKIRAFFFPPYPGAFIKLNDKEYTLLDDSVMAAIAKRVAGS